MEAVREIVRDGDTQASIPLNATVPAPETALVLRFKTVAADANMA